MVELYPTRRKTFQWRRTLSRWRLPIIFILILAGITYHTHKLYVIQDKFKHRIYGLRSFKSKLPQIQFDFPPTEDRLAAQIRESRRDAVRNAFLHAWNGYRTYAFGHDEIRPCTNESHDPFGGWGATLVDSLSTMLVMELEDEFQDARAAVANITFNYTKNGEDISVFETTIRYLGGLISAYELSGDKLMLEKANELGELLLPAFNTSTGMPYHQMNISDGTGVNLWHSDVTYVAEVGTIQLEFFRLSQHTGNPIFARKAQAVTDFLDKMGPDEGKHIKGLYPITVNIDRGIFIASSISFGGCGDSLYEYFLKEYILVDGEIEQYSRMYLESIDAMKKYMISKANNTDLTFIGSLGATSKDLQGQMDHLACFVPGMLAIGSKIFDRPDDLELAKELVETCVFTYANTTTGLGPESFGFNPADEFYARRQKEEEEDEKARNKTEPIFMWWTGKPNNYWGYGTGDYHINSAGYLLRPETLESLMILYRITGDTKYQEYGWNIFQAIEQWCKTDVAYSAVSSVMGIIPRNNHFTSKKGKYQFLEEQEQEKKDIKTNSMESFFMAETLKYLYLLFSPPDVISLDKFVFNTEAHPLMRRAP